MNAYLLSLNPEANIADQWDFGFVKDFLWGNMWKTPNWQDFTVEQTSIIPTGDKGVVVLPARHHAGREEEVNQELFQLAKCVLFLMGDEEAEFDISKIDHPDIQIWVQNPHPDKHDSYNRIGTGYPPHIKQHLRYQEKDIDVFFAGQITHARRYEMQGAIEKSGYKIEADYSDGFTRGLDHPTYYNKMSRAKIVLCPSGAVIPDSFRTFEALECMATPIADECDPHNKMYIYWDWLFGENTPIPKIRDWNELDGVINDIENQMPELLHKQTAWWLDYKRRFVYKVMEFLA
jgi:hypothetical protein